MESTCNVKVTEWEKDDRIDLKTTKSKKNKRHNASEGSNEINVAENN